MSTDDRRPRRPLSAEERALWRGIARSVKPLRRKRKPEAAEELAAEAPKASVPKPAARSQPTPARPSKAPAPAPLTRRERQKLARGGTPIDARIDLHGMTQAQAHAALARFLRGAQADGARFVLVITGKGGRGADAAAERGVLRRQVPLWLGLPEFRDAVVGFEAAHFAHGGEGALYVRLRRARDET